MGDGRWWDKGRSYWRNGDGRRVRRPTENILDSGKWTPVVLDCAHLKFLNLSSNTFAGSVDASLPVPCMDVFHISGNHLSDSIPVFLSKGCPLVLHLISSHLMTWCQSIFL
jgi:hypothetical protein